VAALENAVIRFEETFKQQPGYIDIETILMQIEQKLNWEKSGMVAADFQKRFREKLPLKCRGVHCADFFVLRRAKMPSILLEAGFISNSEDETLLKQSRFRDQLVDAVVAGLDQWL
jgi:N-acetylmuramoyl-L-alanine amidase